MTAEAKAQRQGNWEGRLALSLLSDLAMPICASLRDVVHAILHTSCALSLPHHLPQCWPPPLSRSSLTTQFSPALFFIYQLY